MYLFRKIWRRVHQLVARTSVERDMDEEMRLHIQYETEENLRKGMAPREARRRALVAFGGVERFKERARDARGGRYLEDLFGNLRVAARRLRRRSAFTLVVVLTLGLSLGATTAIYSVVDGVLLEPLPYQAPERLVLIWDRLDWVGIPRASLTGPQVADLREQATLFDGFSAFKRTGAEFSGVGDPARVQVGLASGNFFRLLGIDAAVGRTFLMEEDLPGSPAVALLTNGFWQRRFAGDPGVVGRVISLDERPVTVVGVLPKDFNFKVHRSLGLPRDVEMWMPLRRNLAAASRGNHEFAVLGRMKEGVSLTQMQAEVEELGRRQDSEWFGDNGFRFSATPVLEEVVGSARPVLLLLLAAVGLLLLIAVGNIATLMLARSRAEIREVSVRSVLGATPGRLFALVFSEIGLLAILGGGLGLLIAVVGLDGLLALAPETLPRREDLGIDFRVFAVTGGLTLITAVLCGIGPALQNGRVKVKGSLREGTAGGAIMGRAGVARKVLVVGEVALAMVLVIGAGLLGRSLVLMNKADPGFTAQQVTTFGISLPSSRYPAEDSRRRFLDALLAEIRTLPGVGSAAGVSALPILGNNLNQSDAAPDALSGEDERVFVDYMRATPEYFETMEIEILSGRGVSEDDRPGTRQVAVIDESLARYWPGGNAVGRSINIFGLDLMVVGVASHARLYDIYRDDRPQLYIPYAQFPEPELSVVVRSDLDVDALMPGLQARVAGLDPNLPLVGATSMERLVRESTSDRRFATTLLLAFALAGLSLAALGVYGILAYSVANRRKEMGIRMALGAGRRRVEGWVLGQGLRLAALGVLVGLVGAFGASRLVAGFVYRITPVDPATYLASSAFVLLVAAVACILPARRAGASDLLGVIKSE